MKVLLLSRYTKLGASSRLRSYQYIPYLQEHGIEVEIAALFDTSYLKRLYGEEKKDIKNVLLSYIRRIKALTNLNKFDLIWIEYEIFPWLPATTERLFSYWKIPYVVDFDDAIFHRYDIHPYKFIRALLGKKIDVIMQKSTLVFAGNSYLADRALKAGAQRVEYLPTVIDLDKYGVKKEKKSEGFTIGWIGSPSTSPYLQEIQPVLAEVCEDKNIKMTIVSSHPENITGVPINFKPWSEENEVEDIQSFDVGIMPLPDTLWSKGKCGYKLIQYMACGTPVIGSNIGANKDIIDDGINGFLASDTRAWIECIRKLRNDPYLREQLGKNGREKVEKEYCLQVTAPQMASLLQSC
jgi:glycosyltransferase involved in cell wall biosynthesis